MTIASITLPTFFIILATVVFFAIERIWPGRKLPQAKGWYIRAVVINLGQLAITLSLAKIWLDIFGELSVFHLSDWGVPYLEGLVGWFVGTFVFYWWHRLRHTKGFWQIFHQIHHSPVRIEVLTSFYKHPIEILTNSFISAFLLFPIFGCSVLATFWYNFYAATGEYFYHTNYRSPNWLRYFIQTPELHSIHHQIDVHNYNFSDIPIWDRIFGTYKDATEFTHACGFRDNKEEKLIEMLCLKDVNSIRN